MPLALALLVAASPGGDLLRHAEALEGVTYDLGGRLQPGRGIDCQGIIFYAMERITRCTWRSWSVMPTRTVTERELGAPVVPRPMEKGHVDVEKLRPGDVLYFLAPIENPREPALTSVLGATPKDAEALWVWHMGVYAGQGQVLHADPFTEGRVARELLADLLEAGGFTAVFATRVDDDTLPARCRRGPRMPSRSTRPRVQDAAKVLDDDR